VLLVFGTNLPGQARKKQKKKRNKKERNEEVEE